MTCFIPARGGSRRFPRKNIAPLRGRPVLAWAIEAARRSALFTDVWVSTDDDEIATIARAEGARVHDRPAATATAEATIVDAALDFVASRRTAREPTDALCIVLATAALIRAEDLVAGARLFDEGKADVVMAVTSFLEPPFWALTEDGGYLRLAFGEEHSRRNQDLPSVVTDAGAFYFARVAALAAERKLYVRRLAGSRVARERCVDIDEPVHLAIAEAFMGMTS